MNKRIISGLAAFALTFSGAGTALANIADLYFEVAAGAAGAAKVAASGTCGENLTWTLDDKGTLTVSGTGVMYSYEHNSNPWKYPVKKVIIGDGVTAVGDYAFYGCSSLESVTIPDSVVFIHDNAFQNCTSLAEINIPNGAESIGYYSFAGCTSLKKVHIPASAKYIYDFAFTDCTSLETIDVDPDNPSYSSFDGALYNKKTDTLIFCPDGKAGISFPDSVKTIGNNSCRGCTRLTDIIIPDTVTYISAGAFSGCSSLESIHIPDGVTTVGAMVFESCPNLKSVNIPDGVTCIDMWAFHGCKRLENITLPDSVKKINNNAFNNCTGLKSINIPNGVARIGNDTFRGCTSLTDVIIPDSVTEIAGGAFFGCTSLSDVILPESVTYIGSDAFTDCTSLAGITIPGSVTIVDKRAFGYIHDKAYIKNDDFKIGCYKDTAGEKYAADNGFEYRLIDGTDIVDSGECGKNLTWTLDNEGTLTVGGEGEISHYSYGRVPWNDYKSKIKKVIIGDGVTMIGRRSFEECGNLESITIPDSVRYIAEYAFNKCSSLKNIVLPDSIQYIGDDSFSCCTSLESITVPNKVTGIGDWAFSYCTNLKNAVISEGITFIGENAFYGCTSLKRITIPDSVTLIGRDAFTKTAQNFKIYCFKDSAGEKYAADNFTDYELINTPVPEKVLPAATPGDGCVTLCWEAVTGAEKYAVAVEVDGKWTVAEKTTDTSCILKRLKAGMIYKVAVIAMFDGSWNKDFSNAINVTPNAAEVSGYPDVTDIEHSGKYHRFRLKWDAVDGAEKYGVVVYLAGKWKIVTQEIPASTTTFTSPKLKAGQTYKMAVCAKVNGMWYTNKIDSRAFSVTIK